MIILFYDLLEDERTKRGLFRGTNVEDLGWTMTIDD